MSTTTYHFKGILQQTGWIKDAAITVDAKGIITHISSETHPEALGYALPAFQNAHSHAFQYAMAGLAEKHSGDSQDDFWGWREAMYQLALTMNPDQMQSIATMLYAEMARHGYTHVAEFHYVHHDKDGKPYSNLAEMGSRLIAAAKTAGIGITLVPMFYQKGGFGQAPNDRQRRFISPDMDSYLKLWEASAEACKNYEHANIGMGVHSMRAVEPELITELTKNGPQDIPFHIHVSEQLKEIEASLGYLKKRPVEWLLENVEMNERFHLVHATHLTKAETLGIAKSNAQVVLCPSTEGNLGDGLFPLATYQNAGGKWSIGTDSHVGLNPLEELRILDYGQRLTTHKRDTFCPEGITDSGAFAIDMALQSGRRAMGNSATAYFEVGQPLDAAVFDANTPLVSTSALENLTATLVYSSDAAQQTATIANGKQIITEGHHTNKESIQEEFAKTIGALGTR